MFEISEKVSNQFSKVKKVLLNFWRKKSKVQEARIARVNAYWDFFGDFETLWWQSDTYQSVTGADSSLQNRPQWGRIGFD